MKRISQFFRLIKINMILMRYAFNRNVLSKRVGLFYWLSYTNPFSFVPPKKSRGESLRLALENLGPIFVKFGQLLSTRQDLLPEDIATELAKLQDRVPPFASEQAIRIIESSFRQKISNLFAHFNEMPLASASIAQVHVATLHDGAEVVVKILRPKIKKIIRHDIALLYLAAKMTERFWLQGKRLRPVALVAEFENTIINELDLMREAASASQLRRNFQNSEMMYVPKIYWEFTRSSVMTMERISGVPISNISELKSKHTNMKQLAEYGVEIFFTQVFRDSFFHADMHPGNLFVDITNPNNPKYIGVDFGIMGTLNPSDQRYLGENLLAFFHRDYRRVAMLHIESGWVPPSTRVDQFESAIRTVCEPIFEKPIKEISFSQLLLRLFQTAEQFQMEVQPQLMLLQKTLFAIEGLGRQLYPDLDLWATAKPFMIRWMKNRRHLKNLFKEFFGNGSWQETATKIMKTPSLFFDVLNEYQQQQNICKYQLEKNVEKNPGDKIKKFFLFGAGLAIGIIWLGNVLLGPVTSHWLLPTLSGLLIVLSFMI